MMHSAYQSTKMDSFAVIVRQSISRVVVALIFVLFCVPAVTRAVDLTPIAKETNGFKFSKSVALPLQKASAARRIGAIRAEQAMLDVALRESFLPLDLFAVSHEVTVRATSPRAPPIVA